MCTSFVPLPCEPSQQNHSNTCTSVVIFQPLPFFVRARTSPSNVIGYSTFPLLAGRACQRRPYFANALVELALYDDNGCSGISRYRGSPVRGCPTELAEHVRAEVDPLSRVTQHSALGASSPPRVLLRMGPLAMLLLHTAVNTRAYRDVGRARVVVNHLLCIPIFYVNRSHTVPHEHVFPHTVLVVRETEAAYLRNFE